MIYGSRMLNTYIEVAYCFSQLSHAKRLQVGCIIVKDDRIISIGYNGTPSGWDNACESVTTTLDTKEEILTTKPEVLHAESNAIAKLAKCTESGEGATLICTHAPCVDCAKLIYQSGIEQLVFQHNYKNNDGLEFLEKCGVELVQLLDDDAEQLQVEFTPKFNFDNLPIG